MLREVNEPQINFDSIPTVPEGKRRVQLLFALALLVVALVLVVLRNGQFWSDVLGLQIWRSKQLPTLSGRSRHTSIPRHLERRVPG